MGFSLFDNLTFTKPDSAMEVDLEREFEITVSGQSVPVKILIELRLNNRVTINKNGILLRISGRQPREEQRKGIDTLMKWAKNRLDGKPQLLESLKQRIYVNGEIFRMGDHEFAIAVYYHDSPKSTAKIFKNNIVLFIARGLTEEARANACSYLVAKCLCKYFLPQVTQRLHELNDRYFKKHIKSVRMRYATSFWGHCSHDGNLVISVRLFFAPVRTVDYVLIHELAHLVHHNHSLLFWKEVEKIMPDYREHEKHLTEHNLKYYL